MIKTLKKVFQFLFKTILILIAFVVILDAATSIFRYKKYYSQTDITHPLLESTHTDYEVDFENNSNHKMEEFKGKVKLIYWHSGCPSSYSWFPKIESIARQFPDSLEVFLITNQSSKSFEYFRNLHLENINICDGKVRSEEKRFKHHHSSHLVILDKDDKLKAYGYQLSQTDSVIRLLIQNKNISESLSKELLFKENIHKDGLNKINNLTFKVTNYNEEFETRASWSTSLIDCKNTSILDIYSVALQVPNYRIVNLTNRDLNSQNKSEKYCVYYKTKSPFAPKIWQMFFDNREKRARVFTADLKERIDKEFGLRSNIIKKRTTTLVLKDIKPNESNNLKKLPKRSEYKHDSFFDNDSSRVNYSYKTSLDFILREIERRIEVPIISDNTEKGKYQLDFSILNKTKFTLDEIMKDLEKQGLIFSKEEREIDYLEIKKQPITKVTVAQSTNISKK